MDESHSRALSEVSSMLSEPESKTSMTCKPQTEIVMQTAGEGVILKHESCEYANLYIVTFCLFCNPNTRYTNRRVDILCVQK